MAYFNHDFAGGKWNHFMDQTHLGYTSWNDPPRNSLRAIKLAEIDVPDAAAMGVAVEGSESGVARRDERSGAANVRCVQSAAPLH